VDTVVTGDTVETGEVDGAVVAVGLPPVPAPAEPTEPADPGETGEMDGAVVAVGLPPVPTTVPARAAPAEPHGVRLDPERGTAAVGSLVAEVTESIKAAERYVARLGF